MHHTCSENMKPMSLAPGRRPFPTQIAPGSTRPKKALHTTRSSSTRGKNPHAPFVARWFQKRPCLTTRSSTPLKELSKGPKTLLPRPKGGRELFAFSSQQLAKRKIAARKKSGASKSTPAKIRKSPKGRRT